MLTSSYEYLKALREGNYLRFLEWPKFIVEHYKGDDRSQDADDTINLIVFEWLNNGYSEEDAKKTALLFAVYELETKPLKSDLAYAVTAISIAAFQCMMYHVNKLQDKFLTKEKMTSQKISTLMSGIIVGLDKSNFDDLLQKQRVSFFSWVAGIDSTKVEKARLQISPIADLRYLAEEYITNLEASKLITDALKSSRLSVVKRLAQYLNEQTELTVQVKDEIEAYVTKIREMKPADSENGYLLRLSPLTLEESTWTFMTKLGISFFNLLQPSQVAVVKTADKATATPS